MCIVVFCWQPESSSPLMLAANRDEFFARPSLPMHWWPKQNILAGRDVKSGGTWLGVSRTGRVALLTNVRDPSLRRTEAPSRGLIVSEFLEGVIGTRDYLTALAARADTYEGFNLICGTLRRDQRALWFFNSQERAPLELHDGTYALSNATLDTPWPKTVRIKSKFEATLASIGRAQVHDAFNELLLDATRADDAALPNTGVPSDWERALSSIFIRHEQYGTRASTQLAINDNRVALSEITHAAERSSVSEARFTFDL
jgi:uncharacterized protein with NRDE domain